MCCSEKGGEEDYNTLEAKRVPAVTRRGPEIAFSGVPNLSCRQQVLFG
jgi:hypothetical protein